jgi:hypothetical protein
VKRYLVLLATTLALMIGGGAPALAGTHAAVGASVTAGDSVAGPVQPDSCMFANEQTIAVQSCKLKVTVWLLSLPSGNCMLGHFEIWDYYHPNLWRNSGEGFYCVGNRVNMGSAWSDKTCGEYWIQSGGAWYRWGNVVCNHD